VTTRNTAAVQLSVLGLGIPDRGFSQVHGAQQQLDCLKGLMKEQTLNLLGWFAEAGLEMMIMKLLDLLGDENPDDHEGKWGYVEPD